MQLQRDHFSPATLSVMDQVAILLHLTEQALALEQTFANNRSIKHAKADTKTVVHFARSVSVDLMEALYHSPQNKLAALASAYKAAGDGVGAAIEAALRLAALEKQVTAGQGNIIAKVVVAGLTQLQGAWLGKDLHITESASGTYLYHLSPANTNATALCGANTMSTGLALHQWGIRGHLNEKWCSQCAAAGAATLSAAGAQLPSA
jgi:hypothetical protein